MTLIAVAGTVVLLVIMIGFFQFQPFLAFLIAALAGAILLGMPLSAVPASIEHGIGDLLGSLVPIICLGAMFGKVIAESGAARRIASVLIAAAGTDRIALAMAATGLIVGIPLFYNVGFVLLVPLIFSVAYRTGLPAVPLAIPMLAGLSIAHGFLPPHPAPTAMVTQFGADVGRTLIYGMIVAVPTLLIAGPLFARTLRHVGADASDRIGPGAVEDRTLPSAFVSFACALLPVVAIAAATLVVAVGGLTGRAATAAAFLGNPMIVLLASLVVATLLLWSARGLSLAPLMEAYGSALRDVAGILLIVAGAGALKQVFIDSGVNAELGQRLVGLPVPPLVLGWALALVIRVAVGSATVAGLTAAGIVQPMLASSGVDPNLMVLAIGAGSLMCSHVNDSGFWLFKEYFNLSLADTFRSWSLMETAVGTFGLIFVLMLDALI